MRPAAHVLALLLSLAALSMPAVAAPLPFVTRPAFGELEFEQPVAIVSPPGETHRLFVLEKPGRICVIGNVSRPTRAVFLDLTAAVGDDESEQGVLALAFHPDFAHNRRSFVWYTSCHRHGWKVVREDRLARFLVKPDDPNAADPASEQILFAQADEAANHNGGELLFGPDGYLYLSLGDEGNADDSFHNSQRIDRDFFAGILRLDVDQRPGSLAPTPHPAVRAGTYAVPPDNPFVGATAFNGRPVNAAAVRTEYWAVGLRNPWRMSFDSATGRLWCGDVGQNLHEEIDLIVRSGNYGWNFREGNHPFRGDPPPGAVFLPPVWEYPRSAGVCVIGGLVYHGRRWPDLEGKYIFADYGSGRIWALAPDGDRAVGPERVQEIASAEGIVSFGVDPRNGDVLLATITGNTLLRLVRNPAAR